MKRWWYRWFPPPLDDMEAQVRAHAIGAFWGLLVGISAVIAALVWALAGMNL